MAQLKKKTKQQLKTKQNKQKKTNKKTLLTVREV